MFISSNLKIKRARIHINELERTLSSVTGPGSIATLAPVLRHNWRGEIMPIGSFKTPAMPEMVPAILGDIVHNLRSSLDLMASQMAAQNNRSTSGVYFPFAENSVSLNEMIKRKNFDRCGKAVVDLLRTFQPYKNGNVQLRAIHDMDIIDKHKGLIPNPSLTVEATVILEERPVVSDFQVTGFTFADDTGLGGAEIVKTCKNLVSLCESILESFACLEFANDPRRNPSGDITADS